MAGIWHNRLSLNGGPMMTVEYYIGCMCLLTIIGLIVIVTT